MPKIDQEAIGSAVLPVPAIEKQQAILARTAAATESLSRLEAELSIARTRGGVLRRSLLAAAFSGRLTGSAELSDVGEMISA